VIESGSATVIATEHLDAAGVFREKMIFLGGGKKES
jgi:hypothetical protein